MITLGQWFGMCRMRMQKNGTRAYIVLESGENRGRVMDIMTHQPGVVAMNPLAGPSEALPALEAPDRPTLASDIARAKQSVEGSTCGFPSFPSTTRRPGITWHRAAETLAGRT
jgi:hypothetical protein